MTIKTRNRSFGVNVSEVICLVDVCFDGTIVFRKIFTILKRGIIVLLGLVFSRDFIPVSDGEIIYFAFEIVVCGVFRILAQSIVNAAKNV